LKRGKKERFLQEGKAVKGCILWFKSAVTNKVLHNITSPLERTEEARFFERMGSNDK